MEGEASSVFPKYPRIENVYNTKAVDSIRMNNTSENWIVTEKIHGANFSFHATKDGVRAARRTGFIETNENFYGFQKVFEKYRPNVEKLFKFFNEGSLHVNTLIVYGELYGGNYPHPKALGVGAKPIQQGVYYSPDVEFIAYDLCADGNFLSYCCACMDFENFKIPYVKIDFFGSFEDALEFSKESKWYQTFIPGRQHKLPPIRDNIREGNVIKPAKPEHIEPGDVRTILKDKNERFSEVKNRSTKSSKMVEISEDEKGMLAEISKYITSQRLESLFSKYGETLAKNKKKLFSEFKKDIIEDFEVDFSDTLKEKPELRNIYKRLNPMIWSCINHNETPQQD